MDEDVITSQIDELLEALRDTPGKDLSRDVLEKELRKFLEYGVPFEHAKQTLVKKFGGTGGQNKPTLNTERTLIVDLQPNQQSVHVRSRIISVNPRDIQVKGEAR